jgi:hypothetical protein
MNAVNTSTEQSLREEVEQLQARVIALESELVETQARANTVVSQAQERVYWLDRWHLDLNALMRRPGAAELRGALRAVRAATRLIRQAKRRLGS